jgi:hypothetical protein
MINAKTEVTIEINGTVHTLSRADALKLLGELKRELGDFSVTPREYIPLLPNWNNGTPNVLPFPPGTITC